MKSIAVFFCLAIVSSAAACNIPVFRYALERWPADAYQMAVFHRGPLSDADRAMIDKLRHARANCKLQVVDVSQPMDGSLKALWSSQAAASLPLVLVRTPETDDERAASWSRPLTQETVQSLLDSPARGELVRRLCQGDSVVWLVLESGKKQEDEGVVRVLQHQVQKWKKEIQLPDAAGEAIVPLLSELPLQLKFSVLPIARTDAAEALFAAMLLGIHKDLAKATGPSVFAVFGRGRVLDGWACADITTEMTLEVTKYICGACSCELKHRNPGIDLLLTADWEQTLKLPAEAPAETIPIPRGSSGAGRSAARFSAEPGANHNWQLAAVAAGSLLVVVAGALAVRSHHRKARLSEEKRDASQAL